MKTFVVIMLLALMVAAPVALAKEIGVYSNVELNDDSQEVEIHSSIDKSNSVSNELELEGFGDLDVSIDIDKLNSESSGNKYPLILIKIDTDNKATPNIQGYLLEQRTVEVSDGKVTSVQTNYLGRVSIEDESGKTKFLVSGSDLEHLELTELPLKTSEGTVGRLSINAKTLELSLRGESNTLEVTRLKRAVVGSASIARVKEDARISTQDKTETETRSNSGRDDRISTEITSNTRASLWERFRNFFRFRASTSASR